MRALVQDQYGLTECLSVKEIDRPVAGADEVLVRVRGAGVNIADWFIMRGNPYVLRIAGYGLRKPRKKIRGTDVAGTVESVGANVTRFAPGDEVFGWCEGAFAEYVAVPAANLAVKPTNLTFEQAGGTPMAAFTALQALRDQAKVQSGQRVLVNGASGGIGTFAVQFAKQFGAEVTGVCGPTNVELVRGLGADHVIDYTTTDFTESGEYDVILDIAATRPLSDLKRALTPRGTLVLVGSKGGAIAGGMDRTLGAVIQNLFPGKRLRVWLSIGNEADLDSVKTLLESGKVTPVVGSTYPLEQAPAAIDHVAGKHARGKVVVTV